MFECLNCNCSSNLALFTVLTYFSAQVVSITSLALMGIVVLSAQPRNINARLFAIICLSSITYILTTMQYQSDPAFRIDLREYWLPLQFLMNTGAGCLMLLCYSLFQDRKGFPAWMLILFGLQLTLSTLRPLYVPNSFAEIDALEISKSTYFLFGNLPIFMQMLFAIIGVFWVIQSWREDVIESRRTLRWLAIGVLTALTVGAAAAELFVMNASPEIRTQVGTYKTYVGSLFMFLIAATSLKFESLFERVNTVVSGVESTAQDDYAAQDLEQFKRVFEQEKAYLQPGLSIAELSTKASIPQYRLRRLINQTLGYRNFSALVNKYRIRDACEWLENPQQSQIPVLTIALSVGFQSIAPFNQAFREQMSITPSEYRRKSHHPSPSTDSDNASS